MSERQPEGYPGPDHTAEEDAADWDAAENPDSQPGPDAM